MKYLKYLVDLLKRERKNIHSFFKKITAYPDKVLATFFLAPLLLIKEVWKVKSWKRKTIAVVGLLVSLIAAYFSFTWLGSFLGAVFIADQIGVFSGFAFFIGTRFSNFIRVVFSIVVFCGVSFLFLKINRQIDDIFKN